VPPALAGVLCLVLLIELLLAKNPSTSASPNRSYSELASELSQVAGKSEVVINAINDGVVALDGKGNIQLINPAAQQLLGWTKQDSMGLAYQSIIKIIDTKNQPVTSANDPIAQSQIKNQITKSDSFSLQTNSGKTFLAHISVSPVDQPGNGVIVVFRDITSEKSDERQRAEFISTASHEMRTPVASIEGYLGLALNPATATVDEKAREFITKAHESAQHLGNLFSDLLDVSKADDSRLKNDPTVIDIVPFIQSIVEGLSPKAASKGLRILYKPMPDGKDDARRLNPVYYVNVDNDHLREVADNLIENAIKYTPKGDVVVDVAGNNDKVIFSVMDTGIGIPREDQAHLFQKFYRVDNSDTRTIGGTGLGLYLCRRLSEAMGGRIWVESEYKKGSTFYVELPRVANDEATRLIEQASIEAEKRIAIEQAQAAEDAAVAANQSQIPQAPANSPAPAQPAFSPVSQPVPVTTASPSPQLNPSSTQNSSMQTPRTINPPITIPPRTRT
jgi:PAS domain S-box-containing protein